MKRNLLIASIAVAAAMPASAMVKEYSIGVGLSDTKGKIKSGSFSTLEPTLNFGLTFDNNIMIGTGVTSITASHSQYSNDISNGIGGTHSSIQEKLKFKSIYHFRAGYKFETDFVYVTPYIGANAFYYNYDYQNAFSFENESISDTEYVPFIGADFALPAYPVLSVGFRYSDTKTISKDVEISQGAMVTFSVNI
ncbi:outer membrane beta-barrel protein [Vibrio crassostreae]|uniref:outer membrane beta-barrel protein n=1 Tax=Vibrio crassostreae TaxID=246167 RepID=UPI000637F957|nr:outer membrane beta-barrel protein [Vibrio crassostreae]CAH6915941.1 exported hypothetical protein [Vibrio chagasii]CAH7031616.1 exported hypothetical protein [Vibrio chagasii]CAH7053216.1 exported hypothetical protein [Vibrio chagasii]CDT17345.1 exported hypothetical protein [Vibrio crassostreae]